MTLNIFLVPISETDNFDARLNKRECTLLDIGAAAQLLRVSYVGALLQEKNVVGPAQDGPLRKLFRSFLHDIV